EPRAGRVPLSASTCVRSALRSNASPPQSTRLLHPACDCRPPPPRPAGRLHLLRFPCQLVEVETAGRIVAVDLLDVALASSFVSDATDWSPPPHLFVSASEHKIVGASKFLSSGRIPKHDHSPCNRSAWQPSSRRRHPELHGVPTAGRQSAARASRPRGAAPARQASTLERYRLK